MSQRTDHFLVPLAQRWVVTSKTWKVDGIEMNTASRQPRVVIVGGGFGVPTQLMPAQRRGPYHTHRPHQSLGLSPAALSGRNGRAFLRRDCRAHSLSPVASAQYRSPHGKSQGKPDAEFLYYVGCAGSFDDRKKKTTKAVVARQSVFHQEGMASHILLPVIPRRRLGAASRISRRPCRPP